MEILPISRRSPWSHLVRPVSLHGGGREMLKRWSYCEIPIRTDVIPRSLPEKLGRKNGAKKWGDEGRCLVLRGCFNFNPKIWAENACRPSISLPDSCWYDFYMVPILIIKLLWRHQHDMLTFCYTSYYVIWSWFSKTLLKYGKNTAYPCYARYSCNEISHPVIPLIPVVRLPRMGPYPPRNRGQWWNGLRPAMFFFFRKVVIFPCN